MAELRYAVSMATVIPVTVSRGFWHFDSVYFPDFSREHSSRENKFSKTETKKVEKKKEFIEILLIFKSGFEKG